MHCRRSGCQISLRSTCLPTHHDIRRVKSAIELSSDFSECRLVYHRLVQEGKKGVPAATAAGRVQPASFEAVCGILSRFVGGRLQHSALIQKPWQQQQLSDTTHAIHWIVIPGVQGQSLVAHSSGPFISVTAILLQLLPSHAALCPVN